MAMGEHISTITLNVNRLNNLTKIYRLAEWIQRQDVHVCCPQETYVRSRDIFRLKVRVQKKLFHANRNQTKVGVAYS